MIDSPHVWALILAGGEGRRLNALTTKPCGTAVPKQFCSLRGGHTLIEDAAHRAGRLVEAQRICTIVSEPHRQWWSKIAGVSHLPRDNVIVQPRGRGTAIGILYAVLHILRKDPDAVVALLPADHHVRHEGVLCQSLRVAVLKVQRGVDRPVLLGLEPDEVDTELGYIVPGARDSMGALEVLRLVEKPDWSTARKMIWEGGVWNTCIVAAPAQRLVDLFRPRFAALVMEMQAMVHQHPGEGSRDVDSGAVDELYERLPYLDFSRDLLEGQASSLRVVRAPPCGWSDLGTPDRVGQALRRLWPGDYAAAVSCRSLHINLAAQYEQRKKRA